MKKFLIFLFIILSLTVFITANEKEIETSVSSVSFQFNQLSPITTKFSTSAADYEAKSIKMRKIGIAGIPLIVIGITLEIGGLALFALGYSEYLLSIMFGRPLALHYMIFYYAGLAASLVFDVMFLAGLVMTIVGFAVSAYYKKKAKKVSFNSFSDFDRDVIRCGFVLKMEY